MHNPVLLKEIVEFLPIPENGILIDGTLGNGGHSLAIATATKKPIKIIGIDQDSGSIERAKEKLAGLQGTTIIRKGNFRKLDEILSDEKIKEVDGIILDLGFSSDQLNTPEGKQGRGFSFQTDEPLLMTLCDNPSQGDITAKDIVNSFSKENLETIIRNYGEEKNAKKIAEAIVEYRATKKIETSLELASLIEKVIRKRKKIHPATKTFQAIRIAVNDELRALEEFLPVAIGSLKKGGRLAIISFHSLEDRIVKNFGKENAKTAKIKIITKKPLIAKDEEINKNPRSRSAKLRIFEKI